MKIFSLKRKDRDTEKTRRERYQRVLREGENIFRAVLERNAEKTFFWRVVSMATLGLFFFSLVPQFAVSSFRFSEEGTFENSEGNEILFLEDGFLKKPEKWTKTGDRSDIADILEYAVEEGDTMNEIATRFGVSEATIIQNNGFLDKSAIKPGVTLKIPAADGVVHTVVRGETLLSIAKKYGADVEKIKEQNQKEEGDNLFAGEEIVIPGATMARPVIAKSGAHISVLHSASGIPAGRETFGKLLFPTNGKYTQGYHYGHYAVDIAQNGGSPIWAAEGGTVLRAENGWNGGYGNVIIIDHGNGMQTLYAHNREIYVSTGDVVARGQPIASMGNTGRVYGKTGIHLHFEVIVNGAKVNPTRYF